MSDNSRRNWSDNGVTGNTVPARTAPWDGGDRCVVTRGQEKATVFKVTSYRQKGRLVLALFRVAIDF